jgi:hypothetical protein
MTILATDIWGDTDFKVIYLDLGFVGGTANTYHDIHRLSVFPQVTSQHLQLDVQAFGYDMLDIEIWNMAQQLVQRKKIRANDKIDLEVDDLGTGHYIIVIKGDGRMGLARFSKM